MRGAFSIGQISNNEKSDILRQHREIYNGYKTMLPQVPNTQPLYVQDFANDKGGLVVNNKGDVKPYTNMGINEQIEESKEMCSECGGMMQEGECTECGNRGMEEQIYEIEFDDDDTEGFEEISMSEPEEKKPFMPKINLGKYDLMNLAKDDEDMDEGIGHLDDIYDEEDINNKNEFDYVNEMNIEPAAESGYPVNEYEHMESAFADEELEEVTVGDLMKGKKYKFDFPTVQDELEYGHETDEKTQGEKMYKFKGKETGAHLLPKAHVEKYMKDIDEVDISGSQGIYADEKPAYDFISDGPGKGGPYQEFEQEMEEKWSEVDEDLQESFINQKNRIMEMMNRMKVIK